MFDYEFSLWRVLRSDRRFRWAFAALVLTVVLTGALLPRIWRVTPRDFRPEVKLRGLNYLQAAALKRTASQALAAGKLDEADYAWRAAINRNPADGAALRGYLETCVRKPKLTPGELSLLTRHGFWLLRLSNTNHADAELCARAFAQGALYDLALYLLGPRADRLSPPAEAALLQAIFHTDQIGAFAGHWAKAPAEIKQQPDLQLLWAAYQAGWGTGEQQTAGEQALLAALDRPEQQELAGHLLLVARAQAGKTEAYAQVLKQREQSGTDRLVEHLIYWRLLDRAGRRADAQALALACDRQPAMTFDLLRLGQVLVGLGLVDRAITCLQDRVLAHDSAEELWALYTDLLIGNQRWHDLRAAALRLREGTGVGGALEGFSYYLEGRAELGLERLASARAAFGRLADSAIPSPSLAWRTGQALIELDQWQAAKTLLVQAEPAMENNLTFYSALFTVGQRLRDPGLLLRAAERAYRLDPANPTLAGNYATALLVNRQAPAEAIRLTLLAYNQDPEGPGPCLNHALALLQNQRLEEAGRLLATIRTHEFTPDGLACYYATCAEVFLSLGQSQRAREMLEQVEPAHLFPAQARWIAEARESIVALKASAQASPTTLKAN